MPDFNLAAMSLAELRDLQKSVAKAISTFEARQKAEWTCPENVESTN